MSRTSEKSRTGSALPTRTTGSCFPASISASCRASALHTNAGSCPGPVWLNGRARTTSGKRPSARSPRWSAPGASGSPASRGHGPAPRTSPYTTCPASRSAAAATGPAKPAMPVTKTRIAPSAALQALQVGAHHHLDQLAEGDARRPAEHAPRLGGVAHQAFDLGGAEQRRVLVHVLAPVEPERAEGDLHQLAHGVGLAGRHHVVVGPGLLQHAPHGVDVVAGEAPVAPRLQVPETELAAEPELHARGAVAHLARDELAAAAGGFVIEKYSRARVDIIALSVVHCDEVSVDLGDAVGAARVEGRSLALRRLAHLAEHLARAGLVEARPGRD